MPHQRVALVECLGVHAVHMPHQTRQIGLARVQYQVIVISHLAIGQHLSIEPVHRLNDDFQVRGPVLLVAVDRLTAGATRGDVVDGTGKLDSEGAGHAGIVAE